jgi:hypothetical protein
MAIRSDLQNPAAKIGSTMTPKVAPSNQYGESAKLMRGLKDVPASAPPTEQVQQQPQGPRPGAISDLLAPTSMPNEPITSGADFGPGMSSFQAGIGIANPNNDAMIELRNISRMFPDSGIADLLDKYGA